MNKQRLQPVYRAEQDHEIAELFKVGFTIEQLALKYEMSVSGIRRVLGRAGVDYLRSNRAQKGVPSNQALERIADGHRYGLSEAGRMHRCSRQNIHILMNRWKVWLPIALEKFPV